MAIVYLAWDIVLRQVAAIRTLLPGEHLPSQRIEDAWIIDDFDPDKHSDEVPRRSEGAVSHDAGHLHVGDLTPTACVVPSDILEGMFAWASSLMPLDSIVGRADPGSALATDRYQSSIQHRSGTSWTRTQSMSPPGKIHTHSP
jgi:hypothetical protein